MYQHPLAVAVFGAAIFLTNAAHAQQPQSWYWCNPTGPYYPQITECPGGWQEVPAQGGIPVDRPLSSATPAPAPISRASPSDNVAEPGHEWMQSAPAFCQTRPYSNLTREQMASCDEAAFRYLSKNWRNVTASNGQVYEIAMDTIYRNLPPNMDPGAKLRAATVVVYESQGSPFNSRNVQRLYFDCHDHYQTFQQRWSAVTYMPSRSIAAEIAAIACEKSPPPAVLLEKPEIRPQTNHSADALFEFRDWYQSLPDHPDRIKLLECMGIKVYEDPQPAGHPPSQRECLSLEREKGIDRDVSAGAHSDLSSP